MDYEKGSFYQEDAGFAGRVGNIVVYSRLYNHVIPGLKEGNHGRCGKDEVSGGYRQTNVSGAINRPRVMPGGSINRHLGIGNLYPIACPCFFRDKPSRLKKSSSGIGEFSHRCPTFSLLNTLYLILDARSGGLTFFLNTDMI